MNSALPLCRCNLYITSVDESQLRRLVATIDIVYDRNLEFLGKLLVHINHSISVDRLVRRTSSENQTCTAVEPTCIFHMDE